MPEIMLEPEIIEIPKPDISNLVTEDDTPVDNIFSEKQQRLLTETLNTTWRIARGSEEPFVALTNWPNNCGRWASIRMREFDFCGPIAGSSEEITADLSKLYTWAG